MYVYIYIDGINNHVKFQLVDGSKSPSPFLMRNISKILLLQPANMRDRHDRDWQSKNIRLKPPAR